jgi:hypothetical protein
MTNRTSNWYKKFFVGASILFAVSLVALGVSLLGTGNGIKSENVQVSILGKTYADGGEPLTFQVTIGNKNPAPLELANLVLEYPDAQGTVTLRREIGNIPAKGTHTEEFLLKLYGQEGSTKNLTARIEYRVRGSNAIFEQTASEAIVLRSSPIRLTVENPLSITSRQKFTTKVTVSSNSTEIISGVLLSVKYPAEYNFAEANPAPNISNNLWDLGDMNPGETKIVSISGSLEGVSGQSGAIQITLGSSSGRRETELSTVFETKIVQIGLQDAFLGTTLSVNGQKGTSLVIPAGKDIDVEIAYRNTLPTSIRQAEITAQFSGNAFDPVGVSVSGGGFYNSSKRSIVWASDQNQKLVTIPPGGEGSFQFRLTPKQTAGGTPIADPVITIDTSVKGITTGGDVETVDRGGSTTIHIGSVAKLESESHFGTGAIKNSGPFPPRVNQETTYAVTWRLSNSSNTLSGATVSATLPTNVEWKNSVVPAGEADHLSYNAATRMVTWALPTVPRGVGFGSSPKLEVSFQVGITPSQSQSGERPPLTNEVTLKAVDSGTGLSVSITKPAVTTRVSGEGNSTGAQGLVQP